MNQIKIGEFLKELRKEKELTQEQLAEQFNVSRRTVSRWETGNNIPDLSLLCALADFYQVDIGEIFEGERSRKNMNDNLDVAVANTEKFVLLKKIVEYSELEKELIIKKMYKSNLIALASLFAAYAFSVGVDVPNYFILLKSIAILLALFAVIDSILYATRKRRTIKNDGQEKKSHLYWPIIVCAILAVVIVAVAVVGLQATYPGEDVWMSLRRIFG